MWVVAVLSLFTVFSNILLVGSAQLDVETTEGIVSGNNNLNETVFEFHGIPYATAPTGEHKFKAPLLPQKRNVTFLAENYYVKCLQISPIGLEGVEQCLVLNVFRPNNGMTDNPVVVYIHGGAFSAGFGNILLPRSLAQNGIVAVTFNYRLGPLGFLSLQTKNIPGNAGLKDQLMALKWVQNNIANFGGDTTNITLAGYGSGAVGAELIMLSSASQGLFQRVILESGTGAAQWSVDDNARKTAKNYAYFFESSPELNNITALEEFYINQDLKQLFSNVRVGESYFIPCIENFGNDKVVVEHPLKTLQSNTYRKMPIMLGFNDADGLAFEINTEWWMKEMNTDFAQQLPRDEQILLRKNPDKVLAYYFNSTKISRRQTKQFIHYLTDVYFGYPAVTSARYHAVNNSAVYLYEFSYVDSELRYGRQGIGAGYCAQTQHVFNGYGLESNATDILINVETTKLWTNFITNGNPKPAYWLPLNLTTLNYLEINQKMEMKTREDMKSILFWDIDDYKINTPASGSNILQLNIIIHLAIILIVLRNIW